MVFPHYSVREYQGYKPLIELINIRGFRYWAVPVFQLNSRVMTRLAVKTPMARTSRLSHSRASVLCSAPVLSPWAA